MSVRGLVSATALAFLASCSPRAERGAGAGDTGVRGPAADPAEEEPAWKAEIRRRLGEKVSADFGDTALVEALGHLGALCEVNFVIDAPVRERDADTSLELRDASATRAVERILAANGLTCDLIDHVIFVGEPSRVAEVARLSVARRRRAASADVPHEVRMKLTRPMSTCFVDTPLHEILQFLSTLSGVEMVLDDAAADLRDEPVNLDGGCKELTDVPLGAVLTWTVRAVGLEYEVRGGRIIVSTPERLGLTGEPPK